MFSRRHITLLGAGAAVLAALALPSGASAAQPCVADLAGPAGIAWKVQQNGTLRQSTHFAGGSAFDANQGQLFVGGAEYTAVPNDPPKCSATATSLTFPSQQLSGLFVSRSISSAGSNGQMRTLDTITNPFAQQKVITLDYRIKVLGSQVSVKSESGNTTVDKNDHWAVLNSGGAFPFLQWGLNDGLDPVVQSDDPDSPTVWQQKVTSMPDANLHYEQVVVGGGQTIRFLHVIGGTTSQASAASAAADSATPFTGYSKTVANQIVNWGPDPDKDGISKANDDCPSVKGNTNTGCIQFQPPPPNGDDPAPDPQQPQPEPQPGPGPTDPTPTPGGGDDTPPVKKDKTAPVVSVTKLSTSAKKSLVTGKGLVPRVRCNESCTLTVRAQVQRMGSKKLGTVLTLKGKKASASTQKLTVKVKTKSIAKLAKQRLTLIITAVDAAGNKRTVTKTVKLTS